MALVVSAYTCMQVVEGSNPTDGWKIIGNATAFSAVAFKMILRAPVRVPVHFIVKKAVYLQMHSLTNYYLINCTFAIKPLTKCYQQTITDSKIDQVSVALMVSADTCTQVVQGSNPTDGWKVIGNAAAFSAAAFKMILRAPVRVPVLFIIKFLSLTCLQSKIFLKKSRIS